MNAPGLLQPGGDSRTPPAVGGLPLAAWAPLLVSTLGCAVLSLAPSWFMMEVYARVVDSRNLATLAMLVLAVLALIAVLELVEWHRAETLREAAAGLDAALACRVFRLSFGVALRQGAPAGARALSLLEAARGFLVSPALAGLLDVPAALLFVALLWLVHPALAAVALAAAAVQVAGATWLAYRSAEPARRGAQGAAAAQRCVDAAAEQAPVVEALGMHAALQQRWQRLQAQAHAEQQRAADMVGFQQSLSRWLQQAVGSALLGAACWLLLEGRLSGGAGMLIIASILGGKVVAPLLALVTHWRALVHGVRAWRELGRLIEADTAAAAQPMPLPVPRGRLSVEQLVVAAPAGAQRAPLLKGLSFQLAPGETLVVLGNSGAGKTTLARALIGVVAPAAGAVRLDGVDVSGWDRDELGPHLGYLPERVELLDGSVAQNIARFGERDETRLADAVVAAGLESVAGEWPDGLDTELGEGGTWLSGGLRQRIGLARALYGRPAFVVLDEPNASLDRDGEQMLARALTGLKARGCTVLVMSHRRSIVGQADRLLVLRDGQQAAFGPRDEVLAALRAAAAPAATASPTPQARRAPGPAVSAVELA